MKSNYDLGFVSLPPKYDENALEDVLEQRMTRFLLELGEGWAFVGRQKEIIISGKTRRTMLRLALTLRIITTSRAQRKTFDRLLNVEEYMKKTCGMNRDTGLPQVFLLLKFGCADIINMTYRCRVTCVSICMERERT